MRGNSKLRLGTLREDGERWNLGESFERCGVDRRDTSWCGISFFQSPNSE